VIKSLSHLPVIVAPGSPDRLATAAMACASIAADGLIVEMQQVRHLAVAVGRRLAPSLKR
jgi:3-deoxy-D-arabino-heptulosonate 7-phosphate (DAHP) synthase